ncbi:TonB-dependent receptor [Desulfobacula toluolica]|uniref:TonB-dependent receptor, related to iron transport n=1 Tax=Desulfobacula toluolica (strain DSM 7467 / Tol2) TaxID=651182 RepID=K0NRB6_DESTT|nr:TonB-dependent receptor [Desulfobacula toluolica]CCK81467.1 TonB-dependent receptor, related to iron transport [Desulfobacula toluolica Tol2]
MQILKRAGRFFMCLAMTWMIFAQAQAQESVQVDSITITANKMEENVQDVSAGITVFTEKSISDLRIDSISDVAAYTPNFMIYENGISGANAPVMRGMFADIHSHSVSAGMYVDGVPILDGMAYEQDMLDIERIEVLKGPQGTLYGKSSEAGVINIVTKKPGNIFTGKIAGEAGMDNKRKALVSMSGPMKKDKLYFGICALQDEKDGWVEDKNSGETVDDIQRRYGSAKLRYTPADNLDIVLQGSIRQYDDEQGHMNLTPMGAAMYGLAAPENRKVTSDFSGGNKSKISSQSLNVDWDVTENLKITSTTAHRKLSKDMVLDYDFSPQTFLHCVNNDSNAKLSQELRTGFSNEKLKLVTGFYADKDKIVSDYTLYSIIPGMAMASKDEIKGTSGSAFTHAGFLLGEKLTILGGLRYDYQKKEYESAGYSIDNNWDEISPKIGVEYKIKPTIITYAGISKGYLSGGFNPYAHEQAYLSYDEEKLWSYEIGAKSSFFDNRLILNAAVYYMDIDDLQVHEMIDSARSYTTNAARATGKGFELELTAMPVRGLSFMAGVGLSDVEFDEFKDAAGNYKGNKKPYAPEYSFNVGVQYRSVTGFYCRADITGYGDMYTDKKNEFKRDAYELVNAKIGYETEKFDVYIYGKNIFDKAYDSVYGDGFYVNYSKPAEAGVTITYRF